MLKSEKVGTKVKRENQSSALRNATPLHRSWSTQKFGKDNIHSKGIDYPETYQHMNILYNTGHYT